MAALSLVGPTHALVAGGQRLIEILRRAAVQLAERRTAEPDAANREGAHD